MTALFILDVTTGSDRTATLHLQDGDGSHVAVNEVSLDAHPPSMWSGLFDTRRHVSRMRDVEAPEAQLAALGRFLGEHVLGREIAAALAAGVDQRTVLVRLPDPEGDGLAAAFARVPWELARAPGVEGTLLDRNVVVRAAPAGVEPGRELVIAMEAREAVRVLLVFAEAPGSRPLAARLERERLREMFFAEVLPGRNVEVDVLCHGVTRRRLRELAKTRGGYLVLHWSGRGHLDALEIAVDEGEKAAARISGAELVGLFTGPGGFIPLVFLEACDSGALFDARALEALRDAGRGVERVEEAPQGEAAPALDAVLAERVGFTGTALALVRAGVKQVVAMRYEVGDAYARRLAKRFYRRLLADPAHLAVDAALALARGELSRDEKRRGEYEAVDHASPLVFGGEPVRFEPHEERSAQKDKERPKPQPLLQGGSKELDPPHGFVGRGQELTVLARRWLDPAGSPVALVQGPAGLGKTSLAAEAVHLWFDRFDHVLVFQAKGGALSIEEFYRRLDQRLALLSPSYRAWCDANYLERMLAELLPSSEGGLRDETLRNGFVDALTSEWLLIVLDNFEANLLTQGGPEYAAQDPAWDALLEALADRLRGTGSRVLITSRHKLAALKEQAVWIPLGPLPMAEARPFFDGQPSIRGLLNGDAEGKRLAWRILDVSRGHPLVLARIADLARGFHDQTHGLTPAGRAAVAEALDKITGRGSPALPEVFVGAKTDKEREEERAYLEEVAVGAVDLLIERLSRGARSVLWVVTRAGEPVPEDMIAGAVGRSPTADLEELCSSGLLQRDGDACAFHELVAERAAAWMDKHPDERSGKTEVDLWTAYGQQYGALFKAQVAAAKRDQAAEAGRLGIRYLVRARAFEQLGHLAKAVVTGPRDPALLGQVITDLQAVAAEVPAGAARWSLRTNLAAALVQTRRRDQVLSLYAQAAEEAEAAEGWADLGWIHGSWARALVMEGQLDRARERFLKSAEAMGRSGQSRTGIIGMELEALRMDVQRGRAEEALPAIEAKLGEVRAWWASRRQGQPVPEAPDGEVLARTLVSGLDIARHANLRLERWQACIDLLGEQEQVERDLGTGEQEVARTRFNRYPPLMKLGNLVEARAVLEGCLDVLDPVEDATMAAKALSALADVWNRLGDPAQAIALERRALALRDRLPDARDRATSHEGLAIYLHAAGTPAEAASHQLAAFVYRLLVGTHMPMWLSNLVNGIRQSAARNETFTFTFPPLSTLLADPAFSALRAYLPTAGADFSALQARIDALAAAARASLSPPQ
jgi:tetratricopeptide (TPR) repeat protein